MSAKSVLHQMVSSQYPDDATQSDDPIVIGNPLMLSPDFPPLHTVHATFTAHGVPSLVILTIYYNLPCSFLGVVFPEFLLNLLSGAERSAFPFASY